MMVWMVLLMSIGLYPIAPLDPAAAEDTSVLAALVFERLRDDVYCNMVVIVNKCIILTMY